MIKYNSNTINGWNYGSDNIVKVYRNNAVCYYKITGGGDTPTAQTPCYAVVDDISQYSDTEFEDVFNKADEKWYKLNNLNQYEQYGVYGSGRTITTYEGKLTIDNGYEYQYSGGSWNNVGEVSGSTATLPNVPFVLNYNAKNYNSNAKRLVKTSGQLADVDAVITAGTPTVNDGYLTIASGTRATISGYQTYFNRDNNNPNLTIISKQRTDGSNCHMFANRDTDYNWMYRPYATYLTLHGTSQQGSIAVTTQPVIESVRVDSSRLATYNNYTDNTSSTQSSFSYGGTNSGGVALFQGYANNTGENFIGDFYWVYMSQSTLTDDQVQQVIDYNEGGGGQTEYPLYYDEMQDPPNNVSFSSMTEAEAYECPWWGMSADIDNTDYLFCDSNEWLTKYVYQEVSGDYICDSGNKYKKMQEWERNVDGTISATTNYIMGDLIESASTDCQGHLPQGYTEVEYIENTSTSYIDTNFKPNQDTRITCTMQTVTSTSYGRLLGCGGYDKTNAIQFDYENGATGTLHISWGHIAGWTTYSSCVGDYNKHTYDWDKNEFYRDKGETNQFSASTTYTNFQCQQNLSIFMAMQASGPDSGGAVWKGKMFDFKVYDDGTLIRDLVPCTRDNDSMVGCYDIVNDVFYYPPNYASYPLVAGPQV